MIQSNIVNERGEIQLSVRFFGRTPAWHMASVLHKRALHFQSKCFSWMLHMSDLDFNRCLHARFLSCAGSNPLSSLARTPQGSYQQRAWNSLLLLMWGALIASERAFTAFSWPRMKPSDVYFPSCSNATDWKDACTWWYCQSVISIRRFRNSEIAWLDSEVHFLSCLHPPNSTISSGSISTTPSPAETDRWRHQWRSQHLKQCMLSNFTELSLKKMNNPWVTSLPKCLTVLSSHVWHQRSTQFQHKHGSDLEFKPYKETLNEISQSNKQIMWLLNQHTDFIGFDNQYRLE